MLDKLKPAVDNNHANFIKKLTNTQMEMREQISVVLVQSITGKQAYSYKISRKEGEIIKNRKLKNQPSLVVIQLQGKFYIQPVVDIVLAPTSYQLSFPMRWVHQSLATPQFDDLMKIEKTSVAFNGGF